MIEAAQVRRGNVIEIDGELYRCLEQCYREREDYKLAYEYAAKQLEL